MKRILKNRFVAIALAAVIVVSSSLLSVHVKLNKEFTKVSNDFYNGVLVDGRRDVSVHSQLIAIGRFAEDIASVAGRNGIDVAEFKDSVDYFNSDIHTMHDDISYLHYLYVELLDDIMTLGYALNDKELSSSDERAVVNALEAIIDAKESIEASAYNERVRKYISSLPFPTDILADITGADLPEYFA